MSEPDYNPATTIRGTGMTSDAGPQWEEPDDRDPFAAAEQDTIWRTPRAWLRLWFGIRETVDARSYFISGVVLAIFKYAFEATLIQATTGNVLGPIEFLNPSLDARQRLLAGAPEWVPWVLLAWQLPFVWIAFTTTVRRCANAGLSPWAGMLILVPYLNLVVMLVMSLVPTATGGGDHERESSRVVESYAIRSMAAIGSGLATFLGMFALGVFVLEDYGLSLFFATPIVMGAVSGYVYNRLAPPEEVSSGAALGCGFALVIFCGLVLLAFVWEGAICLLMAAPIVIPLALVGSVVGASIATFTRRDDRGAVAAILLLPTMATVEAQLHERPEFVVVSAVEVDAPPEVVWERVVSFPDLPEPDRFFFRAGIACPLRARIEGTGVGAVRYCEFTTGDFVEPITVWDEPRVLAFDVAEQPHPMREVNPFGPVHPPHLEDMSLRSLRGEFRLVELPGGRTRLEGRTWYTFDMHPRIYWTLWSDYFIHRIHERVLEHVKQLAEEDASR